VPVTLEDVLRSYKLTVSEHGYEYPTVGGILLFGKNPQKFFPEAMIIASHFAGIEGRETISTRDFTGTLFEQFAGAYNFVVSQLHSSFTITGLMREEELEVPAVAIREAIINAIMHRNYHIKAPIKIAIYDNRVEIFSPGDFPGLMATNNLKMGITYVRNLTISKVLRESGYCEKIGSGFITIFNSYAERGLKEPTVIEGDNFIKCILPRPSPARNLIASGSEEDITLILNLFETSLEYSMGDIVSLVHLPRSTVGRRINQLLAQGILKKIGKGKATRYARN